MRAVVSELAVLAAGHVASAVARPTYHGRREADVQDAVEQVLVAAFGAGRVRREVRRGGDRFDFTVSHESGVLVVVELKVGGSRADALMQCTRYLERYDDVGGLVCASRRPQVVSGWPAEMLGRPVRAVVLRSWP